MMVRLIIFMTVALLMPQVESLYLAGHLRTKKSWEFLGRFCFLSNLGRLKFKFVYAYEDCCHNILLYTDNDDQWSRVYKNDFKTCFEKETVLRPEQIMNLTLGQEWSGCQITNKTGKKTLECAAERSFKSVRERWWYIAISNCQAGSQGKEINVDYSMRLTNGESFWTEEFSADEFGILQMNIVFFIICILMFTNATRVAVELANRQMLHKTYKIFLACLAIETFGLLLLSVAYGTFAADGIGCDGVRILGEMLGACSEVGFLIMLLLVAKGYTITRGQLSHSGSIKLAVFCTIYGVINIVLFMYEYVFADPGLVLYVYESPAGYGLITLRMVAWFWFTYGLICTVKHYPEKGGFYYRLFILYSVWFFAVPIMVLISSYIPKYMRCKLVYALELCIDFIAYFTFMILTRPGAANSNFPYHVRTSQIGIVMPNGKLEAMIDFPRSVYGDGDLDPKGRRVSNFVDLFSANGSQAKGRSSQALQYRRGDHRSNGEKDYKDQRRSGVDILQQTHKKINESTESQAQSSNADQNVKAPSVRFAASTSTTATVNQ